MCVVPCSLLKPTYLHMQPLHHLFGSIKNLFDRESQMITKTNSVSCKGCLPITDNRSKICLHAPFVKSCHAADRDIAQQVIRTTPFQSSAFQFKTANVTIYSNLSLVTVFFKFMVIAFTWCRTACLENTFWHIKKNEQHFGSNNASKLLNFCLNFCLCATRLFIFTLSCSKPT